MVSSKKKHIAKRVPYRKQSATNNGVVTAAVWAQLNHLFDENSIPWSSRLIPRRPDPSMYSTFSEYEAASVHWAAIVSKTAGSPFS